MLTRLLSAGLLAGVLSGLCVAGLQQVTAVPLIQAAEVYERAQSSRVPEGHELGHPGHEHGAAPAGLGRAATTTIATVGAGVGFAFLLLALMSVAGEPVTARRGLIWGAAGFVATGLAPALGLAPELPASAGAGLAARQVWWTGTALASAAGLWLLLRPRPAAAPRMATLTGAGMKLATLTGVAMRMAGVILLSLPHIIGAPLPQSFSSPVPAELAARFAATSLGLHALLWSLIGASAGYLYARLGTKSEQAVMA